MHIVALCTSILVVASCGRPVRETLGSRGERLIEGADRMEILRVTDFHGAERRCPRLQRRYSITQQVDVHDPGLRVRFRDALLDRSTYSDDGHRCAFEPNAAFRIWRGGESLTVIASLPPAAFFHQVRAAPTCFMVQVDGTGRGGTVAWRRLEPEGARSLAVAAGAAFRRVPIGTSCAAGQGAASLSPGP